MKDVPQHIILEITHFFETYKALQKKKVKILSIQDVTVAKKDILMGVKNHPLMSESWIFLSTFRNACISDERVACCTPLQKLVVHKERCSVLVPKKLQLLWA